MYPLITKFNYVICHLKLGDDDYLLDASDNKIGFGKLPEELYNGSARIVGDIPALIDLSADSIKEVKVTSMFAVNQDNKISGTITTKLWKF